MQYRTAADKAEKQTVERRSKTETKITRGNTEALRRADHEEQKKKRLAAVKAGDAAVAEITYDPKNGYSVAS